MKALSGDSVLDMDIHESVMMEGNIQVDIGENATDMDQYQIYQFYDMNTGALIGQAAVEGNERGLNMEMVYSNFYLFTKK